VRISDAWGRLEYGGSWFATTPGVPGRHYCCRGSVGGWFQAAPSGSGVPAPTIRVSTHLVLIDVVVTDKQGKAVSGLHPEDFVVEEKGKTQKIAFFTPSGESQRQPAPQLPPGIYSNKPEYRSPGDLSTEDVSGGNKKFNVVLYVAIFAPERKNARQPELQGGPSLR
jgi:hypothetical protein